MKSSLTYNINIISPYTGTLSRMGHQCCFSSVCAGALLNMPSHGLLYRIAHGIWQVHSSFQTLGAAWLRCVKHNVTQTWNGILVVGRWRWNGKRHTFKPGWPIWRCHDSSRSLDAARGPDRFRIKNVLTQGMITNHNGSTSNHTLL